MAENELGEIAMELISDYPLYACTSNITYDEAILIASILFGDDLKKALAERKRIAKMSLEELKAELKK